MQHWLKSFPRGIPLLFMNSLLMSLGFYALIPYLSYYVTNHLLWTPFLAGMLLMIRQMSQQGPTFITGMVADRLGYRLMLSSGLFIRGIGFSMFAFSTHPVGLFAAAIVTGIGGALFEPTFSAALTALTSEKDRGRIYSMKKIFGNVGIVLAALVGALIIQYDFKWLSLVSGGIFIFIGILTYWRLPNVHVQVTPVPFVQMWQTVIHDRYFLMFTAISIGFWFMYLQMFLTIPMHVVSLTQNPQSVSLVYLIFALLIIVGQYPVNRWMSRYELTSAIKLGLLLMGSGLIILGTAHYLLMFLLGFILFALGAMIVEPSNYELTSRLAKREMTATYFGFASLALAVGGGISQGLGGLLLQTGQQIGFPTMIWWISGGVSLMSIAGIYYLEKSMCKPSLTSSSVPVKINPV
jgi:DHA1 family multidrug resistance protein-like MFS transporter